MLLYNIIAFSVSEVKYGIDFFTQNMNVIIKSLVDLALIQNKCGLRIISDPKAENRWTNTCIPKSHYLILEKIVEN